MFPGKLCGHLLRRLVRRFDLLRGAPARPNALEKKLCVNEHFWVLAPAKTGRNLVLLVQRVRAK